MEKLIIATLVTGQTVIGTVNESLINSDNDFTIIDGALRYDEMMGPQGVQIGLRPVYIAAAAAFTLRGIVAAYIEVMDEKLKTSYRDTYQQARLAASNIVPAKVVPAKVVPPNLRPVK